MFIPTWLGLCDRQVMIETIEGDPGKNVVFTFNLDEE